jgi:hypothetical protein
METGFLNNRFTDQPMLDPSQGHRSAGKHPVKQPVYPPTDHCWPASSFKANLACLS